MHLLISLALPTVHLRQLFVVRFCGGIGALEDLFGGAPFPSGAGGQERGLGLKVRFHVLFHYSLYTPYVTL